MTSLLSRIVALFSFPDLHERAWALAQDLNRPTAYDAPYLALAEHLGCEYWTADKRLCRVAQGRLPWVRWLGDFRLRAGDGLRLAIPR